jgi:hypothetical protein
MTKKQLAYQVGKVKKAVPTLEGQPLALSQVAVGRTLPFLFRFSPCVHLPIVLEAQARKHPEIRPIQAQLLSEAAHTTHVRQSIHALVQSALDLSSSPNGDLIRRSLDTSITGSALKGARVSRDAYQHIGSSIHTTPHLRKPALGAGLSSMSNSNLSSAQFCSTGDTVRRLKQLVDRGSAQAHVLLAEPADHMEDGDEEDVPVVAAVAARDPFDPMEEDQEEEHKGVADVGFLAAPPDIVDQEAVWGWSRGPRVQSSLGEFRVPRPV